jgi:glycosyltransferase involved in cell wall biosynthesis
MTAQEPLRILHCFRSPVGGIFRHVRDLAEEHAKAGHQVGILCDSTTGGTYEDKLFETIMPHLTLGLTRLPIRRSLGLSDISTAVKTFRKVKNLQPDVLHGHGAKGGAFVRLVGSRLRVSRSRVARFYSPHGGACTTTRKPCVVRPTLPSSGCSSAGPTAWFSSRITSAAPTRRRSVHPAHPGV